MLLLGFGICWENVNFLLTSKTGHDILNSNETVEAEITVMVHPQRARVAESRVKRRSSNGPLRVQSNGQSPRVFCNVRTYVSCRGYECIPQSARETVNQGGIADNLYYSSLTEDYVLSRTIFCLKRSEPKGRDTLWQRVVSVSMADSMSPKF